MHKKVVKTVEFPLTSHPVSPWLTSYVSVVHLLQLMSQHRCIIINGGPSLLRGP